MYRYGQRLGDGEEIIMNAARHSNRLDFEDQA